MSPRLAFLLGSITAVALCCSSLAAPEPSAKAPSSSQASQSHRGVWLAGGSSACALVLVGAWMVNRRKQRRWRRRERPAPAARPPAANGALAKPLPAPAPAAPRFPTAGPTPSERPASQPPPAARAQPPARPVIRFTSKAEALRQPLNGKPTGKHRRKVFDYNRYFTDLMGAVSGHSQLDLAPVNEAPAELSRVPAPAALPERAAVRPASRPDPQGELLVTQRELMKEQKRLIQEQNQLIEEKSRLIAEKNELLKLQNRLMSEKLL